RPAHRPLSVERRDAAAAPRRPRPQRRSARPGARPRRARRPGRNHARWRLAARRLGRLGGLDLRRPVAPPPRVATRALGSASDPYAWRAIAVRATVGRTPPAAAGSADSPEDKVPMKQLPRRARSAPAVRPRAWAAALVMLALAVASCAPASLAARPAAEPPRAPEDTLARLTAATRPTLDPEALAVRLRGPAPGPLEIPPLQRSAADVGRVEQFHLLDQTQTPNVLMNIDAEL